MILRVVHSLWKLAGRHELHPRNSMASYVRGRVSAICGERH